MPRIARFSLAIAGMALVASSASAQADPLPSWKAGPSKQAINKFVADVTKEGAPGFVPVAERIAVFDNDGTLWSEQPLYFQLAYARAVGLLARPGVQDLHRLGRRDRVHAAVG